MTVQKPEMSESDKTLAEAEYARVLKIAKRELGNGSTSTSKLNAFGKKLFGSVFLGVYPSDQIPPIGKGQFLIFNLDKSSAAGSHWVALTQSLVYDSFARSMTKLVPHANLTQTATERDVEQKLNEDNCGARVIAFLLVYRMYGRKVAKWV